MPLFDFYCENCQKTFEEITSLDDVPPCSMCGSTRVERRMSIPSPVKTGAFPYKPGPVHPLGQKMAAGCGAACCSGGGGFA